MTMDPHKHPTAPCHCWVGCGRPADVAHDGARDLVQWLIYLGDESREGPRYAEAIRTANLLRNFTSRSRHPRTSLSQFAEPNEVAYGAPVGFRTILDNSETPRMTVADLA